MKTIWRLLIVAFMVGGWALSAAALHVIYTGNRITLLPKERLSFNDTYVDPRGWTLNDVASHPLLTQRLIEAGKIDLLAHVADPKSDQSLEEQIRQAIAHGPDVQQKSGDEPTTKPLMGIEI